MFFFFIIVFFQLVFSTSNSARNSVVVISDTHIGGPWFGGAAQDSLLPFLKMFTTNDTTAHTLIILGDLLDLWLFNFSTTPPRPSEMLLSSNFSGVDIKSYVDALNVIMDNGVDIFYVNGNHDDWLSHEEFVFSGLGRIKFMDEDFSIENVRFTHGHKFDYFNARDPENPNIRAFGYLMMRACTESGNVEVDAVSKLYMWSCEHFLKYAPYFLSNATWFYERLIGGSLGETVWGEIANRKYAQYKNSTLKGGCFFFKEKNEKNEKSKDYSDVVMHIAVQKYRTQMARWLSHHDHSFVENLILGACYDFDYWIRSVEEDLFIMGHTHVPELDKYKRSTHKGGDLVYVNSGAWLKFSEYLSYVSVTMEKGFGATEVRLMEFDSKTFRPVEKAKANVSSSFEVEEEQYSKTSRDYVGGKDINKILKQKNVPPGWKCDPDFYNSRDGCDCLCGVWDPDCGPITHNCVVSCKNCDT